MPKDPISKEEKQAATQSSLKGLAAEKSGALAADDSVETAGNRLRAHEANLWPVAKDRKLVGLVTQSNPDWKIGGEGHDPKDWKVGEIMSRELIFCYEDEDVAMARKLMAERGLRYLPVVDRQMRIVGIFSRAEIEEKAKSGPE